ncbi:MAG: hypothetical protein ACR2GH_17700 [Pseudonocardia sp.]
MARGAGVTGALNATVLQRQVADRESKGTIMRIRTAHFPQVKTLEDFNLDHLPSPAAPGPPSMIAKIDDHPRGPLTTHPTTWAEHLQNTRDAIERGLRIYPERRSAECGNGHRLTKDNIYIRPGDEYPVCRTCMKINDEASRVRPLCKARKSETDAARHKRDRDKRLQQMKDRRKRIKDGAL